LPTHLGVFPASILAGITQSSVKQTNDTYLSKKASLTASGGQLVDSPRQKLDPIILLL
jgi:hypothetical protein